MIDIKVEEEKEEAERLHINPMLHPEAYFLREISRTLKDILKEMRKRKV